MRRFQKEFDSAYGGSFSYSGLCLVTRVPRRQQDLPKAGPHHEPVPKGPVKNEIPTLSGTTVPKPYQRKERDKREQRQPSGEDGHEKNQPYGIDKHETRRMCWKNF